MLCNLDWYEEFSKQINLMQLYLCASIPNGFDSVHHFFVLMCKNKQRADISPVREIIHGYNFDDPAIQLRIKTTVKLW